MSNMYYKIFDKFSFSLYIGLSIKYTLSRYTLFPIKIEYIKAVHESLMPKE